MISAVHPLPPFATASYFRLQRSTIQVMQLTSSIRETWQALVSGFFLGRAEHFEKRGNISKMLIFAKKALRWAKSPNSIFGAHIINAKAERLAGQNAIAKDHVFAARKCIEDNPSIRDYRELRDLLSEFSELERTYFARQGE